MVSDRGVPINLLHLVSAVLPIIGNGRLASGNNRYWPIIGADLLSAETDIYLPS